MGVTQQMEFIEWRPIVNTNTHGPQGKVPQGRPADCKTPIRSLRNASRPGTIANHKGILSLFAESRRDASHWEQAKLTSQALPSGFSEGRWQWQRRGRRPDVELSTGSRSNATSRSSDISSEESSALYESSPGLQPGNKEDSPFERKLLEVVDAIAPSAPQQHIFNLALQCIQNIAKSHFSSPSYRSQVDDHAFNGECHVSSYGSFQQRTHIIGSDLDIVLVVPVSQKVDNAKRRQLYQQHLDSFARCLPPDEFQFQAIIPAKVPVLKIWCMGIPLDITVASHEDYRGFQRDSVISEFVSQRCGPRYQAFMRLVKHWSKINCVNDAPRGYMNSTCWTFLCLCYLNILKSRAAEVQPENVPYKTLMEGFFRFITTLGDASWIVDASSGNVERNEPWCPDPLFIRDPFTDGNLACALQEPQWRQTVALCKQSAINSAAFP